MLRSAVSRTTLKAVGQGGLGSSSSHADGMHPNLGLHNAAATGNIGLVKFALENGQPANSNLNGILPLHAACSGGSEQSVRMLIFHGADVNAPRLKAKGSSGGPGAEGSTPLHFAAANGHLDIVRVLLEAGARPAAADKDGVVPEALALGNGHTECANLIRSWISAYGSNGLAGMVESRDIVSGDVTLGPAGYIRYAASGRSASPISPASASKFMPNSFVSSSSSRGGSGSTTPQLPATVLNTKSSTTPGSAALSPQSSSDTLSASNGVRLAASRSAQAVKSGSLSKTTSNPNLRNQASVTATPPLPVASPVSPVTLHSQSGTTSVTAISPGIGAFATFASPDSSDHATPAATRSSSVTSGVGTSVVGASNSGSIRESKRRPSLPSILEKAAHPAASLRAALASSSSAYMGGSMSQAAASKYPDQPSDGTTAASPGKKHSKLAGKRSLSGMLRKATGTTPGTSQPTSFTPPIHASSSSFFADSSAASSASLISGGAINLDALTKPGRISGKSFDYQRPTASSSTRSLRRNAASESFSEDPDASRAAAIFAQPSLHSSRSDAAALDQQRRLRSASSSSSLSAACDSSAADIHVRRARAGSNEQPSRRTASSNARLPMRANASLDLLRPGYLSHAEDHGSGFTNLAGRKSVERSRALSNQDSRTEAMKRANAAQASGLEAASKRAGDPPHLSGRDRSVSGSSSRSAGTADNDRSRVGSTMEEPADEDDVQEFLHHHQSVVDDRMLEGGEHHDAHRLPTGLRTMTAFRQQNAKEVGDSLVADIVTSRPTPPDTNAANENSARPSNALASRMTRDRSGSHTSAVSTGSQSGSNARGMGPPSIDNAARTSPGLPASYQALSIAEENGLTGRINQVHGAGSSTILSRTGRASSVAESLASHPSSSSLRSNYLSAAEQAQAILNHEAPYASDGPDGTSTSLAAQLAAYGEALAMERRRAGDARSGPSPSLSARGSNAALRSKLPSVSEDQSPSRTAGHSSRRFSVSENRMPNLPATAAQLYNRRVSRRPHSSEGRQSQENVKRGLLGSGTMTMAHSTSPVSDRATSGLDPSPGLGNDAPGQAHEQGGGWLSPPLPSDSQSVASPNLTGLRGLGSPMHLRSVHGWAAGEQAVEYTDAPPTHELRNHASGALRPCASDSGEEPGPKVPPKDQHRRRHNPAVHDPAMDMSINLDARGKHDVAEADDEDEDDPKTPVLGGSKAGLDEFAPSPRSLHRHSPSMPTELRSYTAGRQERSPGPPRSEGGASDTTTLASPMPPPRKESINVSPLGAFVLEDKVNPHKSSDGQTVNRDAAMWSSWQRNARATNGGDEVNRDHALSSTSSRWEGLRRPSLNMLRSATSSSTQSQTPSHASRSGTDEHTHSRWSTDEIPRAGKGDESTSSATSQQQSSGKRRLVRTLLNKAKGSS